MSDSGDQLRGRVYRAQMRLSTGGGDTIRLGGKNVEITDNVDNHNGGRTALDDTFDWFHGCNCIYFRTGWGRIDTPLTIDLSYRTTC